MIAQLAAYLAERSRPRVFIPAALAIAWSAQIDDTLDVVGLMTGALFALLLIGQFRLWDDLANIESDRLRHPERVLSRSARLGQFVALGLILATANIAIAGWLAGPSGVTLLIVLDAAMATWYALRPHHRTLAGDLLLLAKYPAFVFIIAGPLSASSGRTIEALAIYGAACAFEIWHDASSPLRSRVNA